jgi:hypothetical protein
MAVKVETAIKYYWKLKATDSIMTMMSAVEYKELPLQEHQRIIDNLIDNHEIKAILFSNNKFESPQPYAQSIFQ